MPEFISILRWIRDIVYPQLLETNENVKIVADNIEEVKALNVSIEDGVLPFEKITTTTETVDSLLTLYASSGDTVIVKEDGLVYIYQSSQWICRGWKTVYSIEQLEGLNVSIYLKAKLVLDGRSGDFIYDATQSAVNNSGTIFNGWVRQYSGGVYVEWFGAVGDGITDDLHAFNLAKAASDVIYAEGKTYALSDTFVLGTRGKRLVGKTPAMDSNNSSAVTILKYIGTLNRLKTVVLLGANAVGAEPSIDCTNNQLINVQVDANNLAGFGVYGTYITNDSLVRDCSAINSLEYNMYFARSWYATFENIVSYTCKGKGLAFGMPLVLQDGTNYSSSWVTSAPLEMNQTKIDNIRSEDAGTYYSIDNASTYNPTNTTHRMQGYGIGAGLGNGFTMTNIISEKSGGVNLYVYSDSQPRKVVQYGYLENSCYNSGLDASSTMASFILENINTANGIEIRDIFSDYHSGGIYHTGITTGSTWLRNIHQPRFLKSLDGLDIYKVYSFILKDNVYYQAGYYNTNEGLMSPSGYKSSINTRYTWSVDCLPGHRAAIYLKSTNKLSNGSYLINYEDGTSINLPFPSPMPSSFELQYVSSKENVVSITKAGGDSTNTDSVTFKIKSTPNANI